jgi:hypothetical protein
MIKKLLLHITRVISAGWCAECWLGGAWLQIVISGAFNNKSVHFVGVIIVWLSTCTEGQQLKFQLWFSYAYKQKGSHAESVMLY